MIKERDSIHKFISIVVGLAIFVAVFLVIRQVFDFQQTRDALLLKDYFIYFLIVSYLLASLLIPVDCSGRDASYRKILYSTSFQALLAMGIFAFSVFTIFDIFAGRFYLLMGCVALALTLAANFAHRIIYVSSKKNKINVVIVGAGPNALRLCRTFADGPQYSAYSVLGFFSDNASDVPEGWEYLGKYGELRRYLEQTSVQDVYCCLNPSESPSFVNDIVHVCENAFVNFFYVPDLEGYLNRSMSIMEIGHSIVMSLRDEPLANPLNAFVKRSLDILLSSLFLCTVFPIVFIFVAIGTAISSPGPVFFRQIRTGYKGKPFTMLKFRSMKVNADADLKQATEEDPRKTKFGDFLRRTSIDEVPQLINVLKGDMSLIGPRPHMVYHTEMYNKLVDEFMVRHFVRPGLTGWAQVNGQRGETKEVSRMAERVKCDIWYIEHWSLGLDIKIFFMTIIQILSGDEQAY
ncbi:MAG: undecaprenyl-phosphate glucose phosphotransferase [Bacteroidales bacterium]|nr:undecaprenyl-phosphate glucose phosphotransferase [Bacteroidales bacterium]